MEKDLEFYKNLYEQIRNMRNERRQARRDFTESEIEVISNATIDVYELDKYNEEDRKALIERSISSTLWLESAIEGKIETLENDKLEYWENNNTDFKGDDSAIRYAVEWWGNAIKNPTFNNQDNSLQSLNASIAMANFAEDKQVSDLEVKRFMRRLYYGLGNALSNWAKDDFVDLTTDYKPTGFFIQPVMGDWSEKMLFPWKIEMYVSADEVRLKTANDNEIQTVFENKQARKK